MTRTKVQNSSLSYDSGSLAFRNRIINGSMEIAQRGTSFVSPSGGQYLLDRFLWGGGSGVVTVTQSTDVPNNTFQNSLRVDVTTADTSIDASDNYGILQRIEGYNVRDLIGQTFTLSFWVKSPKTGVHCVSFRNNTTSDRSYVMEYTVSAANTWEYKTITVNGGLITTGNWNWTNQVGLSIRFELAAGSTLQTTPGSWQVGTFFVTSNQVNCMDNVNNDFFLTGVQLELGPVATPFERRPYGVELALCQRYFEVVKVTGGAPIGYGAGQCVSATSAYFQVSTFTPKRTPPTATLSAGNTFAVVNSVGGLVAGTGASILNYGENHATIQITVAGGLTAGNSTTLYSNGAGVTGTVQISAEL
jgi:hypothetical protein